MNWCETARRSSIGSGRLDLLICSASPPIRPLSFALERLAQFDDFLSKAWHSSSSPHGQFLSALAESEGWNVVLSSGLCEGTTGGVSRYVTYHKMCDRGIGPLRAAVHPEGGYQLIVRPPSCSPIRPIRPWDDRAMDVERAAASIVRHVVTSQAHTGDPGAILNCLETLPRPDGGEQPPRK